MKSRTDTAPSPNRKVVGSPEIGVNRRLMSRAAVNDGLEASTPGVHRTIDLVRHVTGSNPAQSDKPDRHEPILRTVPLARITPTLEHVRSSALGSGQPSPSSSAKPAAQFGGATKIIDQQYDETLGGRERSRPHVPRLDISKAKQIVMKRNNLKDLLGAEVATEQQAKVHRKDSIHIRNPLQTSSPLSRNQSPSSHGRVSPWQEASVVHRVVDGIDTAQIQESSQRLQEPELISKYEIKQFDRDMTKAAADNM